MTESIAKMSLRYDGIYRGAVVDTTDPYQLGRIRIRAYPMFAGIEKEQIPWATPAMPMFTGAGAGFSSFAVPDVETFVFCFFENGDPYQPVYFAEAQTALHGLPAFAYDNYPYSKVLQSKNGIICQILDKAGSEKVLVIHPKGSYFYMDKDGNITAYAHKEANLVAETDDVNIVASATNVNVGAKLNVNIQADVDVNITATKSVNVTAGVDAVVQATRHVTVQSGKKTTVQAADNVEINSAKNIVIAAIENTSVTAEGNLFVTCDGNATVAANGNAVVSAVGTLTLEGATVLIN